MDISNEQVYRDLEEGEGLFMPSYMGIIPRDDNFELSEKYITDAINRNKDFRLTLINADVIDVKGTYELKIEYKDEIYTALVSKQPNNPEHLQTLSFGNKVREEDQLEALNKEYYIDISIAFESDVMQSYLFQLKLLDAIVPDACLLVDFSAMSVLSAGWLKMTVVADIPPGPKYLYTIHAVYDNNKTDDSIYWLHTHGLLRCGSMELEVVNLKNNAQEIYDLLIHAANLFIKEHYKEKQKFVIGYDGLDMNLAWIRWEDALTEFPADMLGGLNEREDENDVHRQPSGILYAVEDGTYMSPEIYAKTLKDNPIVFISTQETERMRSLATVHFNAFCKSFDKHGVPKPKKKSFLGGIFGSKDKEDAEKWTFLVKLGLMIDDAIDETEREHLWYEVMSIENGIVTGKLVNQPYWIANLNAGDVKSYPVNETLTDWIVYSPQESFNPDLVYALLEELEDNN